MTTYESLLADGINRWHTGAGQVTYSFLTEPPAYYTRVDTNADTILDSYVIDGNNVAFADFNPFSAAEQEMALIAIQGFNDVSNVNLVAGNGNSGQVTWASVNFGNNGLFGFAYYPSGSTVQGDIWLNSGNPLQAASALGNTGFQTYIHELGHALGLSHPDNDPDNNANDPTNNNQYTVMSYVGHPGQANVPFANQAWPITPMLYDIQAMQFLYGVNTTTRTGNTNYISGPGAIYGLSDGGTLANGLIGILTIWDAGGIDTIDASNQTASVTISLIPGTFSTIGTMANNVAMAYAVTVANEVINYIENAIGGLAADTLTGNAANNVLNGGAGVDTLVGGMGNDTFVNPHGDAITEFSGGGTDTVEINTTFSLGALAQVENIVLTGSANANASGNAAANRLTGNSGNNILNGNTGADTMAGGAGDDIYYVDAAGDVTTEAYGAGTDLVSSSVSRTLAANIENLNLSGTANIDGNGNTGANRINGNAGNNILRGYEGADTLNGGGGNDILLGGTASDSLNPGSDAVRDIIRFSAVGDSTGSQRDIVTGMDLNAEDVFDFTVVPTALAYVGGGTLSLATINADLATAVNAALAANGAVLFDPTAGDLNVAGHLFLVVDGNGDGVYTPNQDYVVQLVNAIGTLSLDDFT
jgi:serralysin